MAFPLRFAFPVGRLVIRGAQGGRVASALTDIVLKAKALQVHQVRNGLWAEIARVTGVQLRKHGRHEGVEKGRGNAVRMKQRRPDRFGLGCW